MSNTGRYFLFYCLHKQDSNVLTFLLVGAFIVKTTINVFGSFTCFTLYVLLFIKRLTVDAVRFNVLFALVDSDTRF